MRIKVVGQLFSDVDFSDRRKESQSFSLRNVENLINPTYKGNLSVTQHSKTPLTSLATVCQCRWLSHWFMRS